jgi:hypothetical protein
MDCYGVVILVIGGTRAGISGILDTLVGVGGVIVAISVLDLTINTTAVTSPPRTTTNPITNNTR